ncbi:MAG: DUF2232 domain-containing protein [Leptolyngbya sp. SIO4C1]|nr:DUF2232 domain-containing protein [Leptolyngbya sp. SIO4C1]
MSDSPRRSEPPLSSEAAKPAANIPSATPAAAAKSKGPLVMVETAFLASAASLMWVINLYFPPGPLLRILFPVPIALVYLRWNARAAWMATLVSGLLLGILIGPPRSVLFLVPYGVLGVQLGFLWRRRAGWLISIVIGAILMTFGIFFRIWLLSWMAGEDLWGYLVAQITQILDWVANRLLDWGLVTLGALGEPSMTAIQVAAIGMVFLSSLVYLFTVHIAAWLVLERLGTPMSQPPQWVQALLDE